MIPFDAPSTIMGIPATNITEKSILKKNSFFTALSIIFIFRLRYLRMYTKKYTEKY